MIHLFEDYYLDNDNLQFILKSEFIGNTEGAKNFGKPTYKILGYYPKLEQLMQAAVMKKIKESDYQTLKEIQSRQDDLINELKVNLSSIENFLNISKQVE